MTLTSKSQPNGIRMNLQSQRFKKNLQVEIVNQPKLARNSCICICIYMYYTENCEIFFNSRGKTFQNVTAWWKKSFVGGYYIRCINGNKFMGT